MSLTGRVIKNARARGVKVYNRRQWGNISPVYQWRRKYRKHLLCPGRPADTGWQHISVTKRDTLKKDMKELHSIGWSRFKSGVSYNFGIDMVTGEVGLGQSLDAAGTHTLNDKGIPDYTFNQNYVSHALCFIGVPGNRPSEKAIKAAGKLLAACVDEGALTEEFDYNPHRMVAYKDCPTDAVVAVMDDILKVMREELK